METNKHPWKLIHKIPIATMLPGENMNTSPTQVYGEVLVTEEQKEILEIMCDVEHDEKGNRWYKLNAMLFQITLNLKFENGKV